MSLLRVVPRASALVTACCFLLGGAAHAGELVVSILTAPRVLAAKQCAEVAVRVTDAATGGDPGVTLAVQLGAAPGDVPLAFYAATDTGCLGSQVTTVATSADAVAGGQVARARVSTESTAFRYGYLRASVSPSAGVTYSDAHAVQLGARAPGRLVFVDSPVPAQGECSTPQQLLVHDGNAFPVVPPGFAVSLSSGSGGVTFYGDASCQQPVTAVEVSGSLASFTYKATAPTFTLSAALDNGSDPLLAQRSLASPADAGTPAGRLVFVNEPFVVPVAACSPRALVVALQTGSGQPIVVPDGSPAVNVALAAPSTEFFADPACTQPITQVQIQPGAHQAAFHLKRTLASAADVVATAGYQSVQVAGKLRVFFAPGEAKEVAFFLSPPATTPSGSILEHFKLAVRDGFGNAVPPAGPFTLALVSGSSDLTVGGTLSKPLDPGAGYASFRDITLTANDLGKVPITARFEGSVLATPDLPLKIQSGDIIVGAPKPVLPVLEGSLSATEVGRCQPITLQLAYAASAPATDEELTFCVDESSGAWIESTGFGARVENLCVRGQLPSGGATIVLKSGTVASASLSLTSTLGRSEWRSVRWVEDTAAAGLGPDCKLTPTVALELSAASPSARFGGKLSLQLKARDVSGGPAKASAILLVGDGVTLHEVETSGATLQDGQLRFDGEIPETLELVAVASGTGETSVRAMAVDEQGRALGESQPVTVTIEPAQTVNMGCSSGAGGLALLALLLVGLWLLRPVPALRAQRYRPDRRG